MACTLEQYNSIMLKRESTARLLGYTIEVNGMGEYFTVDPNGKTLKHLDIRPSLANWSIVRDMKSQFGIDID